MHCTEVDSFLSTYLRSGGRLAPGEADQYVDEMRESARLVGLDPQTVPATVRELAAYLTGMRPQLRVTAVAAQGAIWGFVPPMPFWVKVLTPARPAWAALVSIAAGLLPRWARRLYGLPGLPTTDLAAVASARALRRSPCSPCPTGSPRTRRTPRPSIAWPTRAEPALPANSAGRSCLRRQIQGGGPGFCPPTWQRPRLSRCRLHS